MYIIITHINNIIHLVGSSEINFSNLRNLSFGEANKFIHKSDGYNFRMTNFQAGIGIGQLKRLNKTIKKKKVGSIID
jgi:dTDP-4-amino-4,6-dideoxygalactose transaminase